MKKLIYILLSILAASISAEEYVIDVTAQSDTVYFRSSAKLEFIEGKSTGITGFFLINPSNIQSKAEGIIQVDLRTLETGIETRDEHMRDRHLHTDKYPYAYFQLDSLHMQPVNFVFDSTYNFEASGKFYIHNVFRSLTAKISAVRKLNYNEKDYFEVRVRFEIKLDDYKIKRPKALFLKLAETIEIEVNFKAYNGLEKPIMTLPDWLEIR